MKVRLTRRLARSFSPVVKSDQISVFPCVILFKQQQVNAIVQTDDQHVKVTNGSSATDCQSQIKSWPSPLQSTNEPPRHYPHQDLRQQGAEPTPKQCHILPYQ